MSRARHPILDTFQDFFQILHDEESKIRLNDKRVTGIFKLPWVIAWMNQNVARKSKWKTFCKYMGDECKAMCDPDTIKFETNDGAIDNEVELERIKRIIQKARSGGCGGPDHGEVADPK